ncbi:MAG: hypothetical protein PGN13_07300 [Patulibacter minatonensis]
MTAVLPELAEQLGARAEALAKPNTFWRRHLRGVAVLLLALTGASGVAYASRGLWQPQLGDDHRGHATASASPVPDDQLEALGVLRRPQTATDRGWASRYALRFQDESAKGVRTGAVRLLSEGARGQSVVLIPMEGHATLGDPGSTGERDLLCLWVRGEGGGGYSCATTSQLLKDGLTMSTMSPKALAVSEGRSESKTATAYVVGLVPDGVVRVRFGSPGGDSVEVPVHENAYVADIPAALERTDRAWLGKDGTEVRAPQLGTVGRSLSAALGFADAAARSNAR